MPGVYDSAEPATHKRITRAAVLPSGSPDTVGASDFGFFGAHNFGIPSLHVPLSNASSAGLPAALTWLGVRMVSLFLSCMTLAFTTPRRFIPTLSRRKRLPHKNANLCAPTWGRRFRLSTRRHQRFLHSCSVSGSGCL